MAGSTDSEDVELLEKIQSAFNLDELEELSFYAGVPYDELAGDILSTRVISLISYSRRHSRLPNLIQSLCQLRPHIDWPAFPGVPQELARRTYRRQSIIAPQLTLFGREELVAKVNSLLEDGRQVLLHGSGGVGKTSLALLIVRRWLEAGKEPIYWLEAGSRSAESIFDALVSGLDNQTGADIGDLAPDEREIAVGEILKGRHRPALLVIDNAWNGPALFSVLQAVPEGVPTLVTSRQVMGMQERIPVGELTRAAALEVLSHFAGMDMQNDPRAAELVATLGYHPYALEIAGSVIRVDGELQDRQLRLIRKQPIQLAPPADFIDKPSLLALMQESYQALDAEAQAVLRAVGALYAPRATPELLAGYLGQDADVTWAALERLEHRSLARQCAAKDAETGETVDYYDFHDLTFSFARALQGGNVSPFDPVPAVGAYIAAHAMEATRLHLDQANLLAAAGHGWSSHPDISLNIISDLAMGRYMRVYGHSLEFLSLLDQAIGYLRRDGGNDPRLHYLLGKRGNAYFERGELANSLNAYRETMATAPSDQRRAMAGAVIGRTLYHMGDYDAGDAAFAEAHAVAAELADDSLTAFIFEMQSWSAGVQGDYERAREFASREATLARALANVAPDRLFYSLLNLGSVELRLGNFEKALALHTEGYDLIKDGAETRLKADILHALGIDLTRLERIGEATERLVEARDLYRQIGNTAKETEVIEFMREAVDI